MDIHVVRAGDTVYSIANQYGVSVDRLIFDNQLLMPAELVVGQALLILYPLITHTVTIGETLNGIATQYGVTVLDIARNNPYLILENELIAGQVLVIQYQGEKLDSIAVNGYAYPFIDPTILQETLLYLSELSIFSYGFTADGELVLLNDQALLRAADEFGVKPIFVLTPFTASGTFNSNLISAIIYNPIARNRLIQNIIYVVKTKGYQGVDVDFEFIMANDKNAYINFVQELADALHAEGYTMSIALAPKTSSTQKGLLYEGIDYQRLGQIADSVLVMTYEWGYTYGPPMAVAPIDKVRQVLDYAVTQIPPEKIDMGIPNYGYDWPLPYVKGETEATLIGNQQAIEIARQNNAVIQYDEVAQSPFFTYTKRGVDHIVWFEDVRSINVKLRTVSEYGFRGAGYWNIMRYFRPNWLLLNVLFNIEP